MPVETEIDLYQVLFDLASATESLFSDSIVLNGVDWRSPALTVHGEDGSRPFTVTITIDVADNMLYCTCSICGENRFCSHVATAAEVLGDSDIPSKIEDGGMVPCGFTLKKKKSHTPADQWTKQLAELKRSFQYSESPQPAKAKFPSGRQTIFVIQHQRYSDSAGAVQVDIATRSVDPPRLSSGGVSTSRDRLPNKLYRNFTTGLPALAASTDPLDQEIADKLAVSGTAFGYYQSHQKLSFTLLPDLSSDLFARLAQSGRLFMNEHYTLHDSIVRLGWLCDQRFSLKFEIGGCDEKNLSLGVCAANAKMTVQHKDLKRVHPWYFIDSHDRVGIFAAQVSEQVFNSLPQGKTIRVPRGHSADLIEKVLEFPLGMGVEFIGCDDVRPERITGVPRPRIHIKAARPDSEQLEAQVQFDYGGRLVPVHHAGAELYDRKQSAVVQLDRAFHDASIDLLRSLGCKTPPAHQGVNADFTIQKKKLPALVAQLIHHGWHVEADGKLYRSGSKFDLSVVSGIDWFELQGKAHFDQTSIDLPALLTALRSGERSVVLDDGTLGMIPEAWIKQFSNVARLANAEGGVIKFGRSQVGLLDVLLAEQGSVNVDEKFMAARDALRGFERIGPKEAPTGFVGTLRPYQELAQGWFEFLRTLGFGGCLADDMGLGKTVQVLALLEKRRQEKCGPSLIVVPRSLIFNWTAEAHKFAPEIRVLDQSHSQRVRGTEHLLDYDLVLTTYGTLRRDAAFLKDFEFDYVILDEAQAIKNATTEAAKAARLLQGRHKLALSGTPIENHLGELWSLFDFLNPGMLGRVGRFSSLASDADRDEKQLLAAAVRPFILRRTKKQVAPELPDRIEQTIVVELDADQRKSYDELKEYYRKSLQNKIESDGIGKSQIVILEALLRLRQAACHPGLIDKSRVGEPSAKLDELITRLTNSAETGERVLVFSQFTSFLAIVKTKLKEAKIPFLYLDGKTKNRQELVEQFQSGTGPAVFLISLKAGGVGLNLTAARSVYLLDPWWNPAVEAQAIDRSHRIGQKQAVFATRLIAANTVEQKVLELQAKKKGLADAIVNADNKGISSLTKEDLQLLLA